MLDNERNGINIWPECILCASFMSPCLQLEPLQMIIWCTAFIYTHYKKKTGIILYLAVIISKCLLYMYMVNDINR